MRAFALSCTFLLCILFIPFARAYPSNLTLFSTEQEAQQHCPKDEIVWLNVKTGIWHIHGARWYGNTKSGAYVCKKEAADSGNRESLNG